MLRTYFTAPLFVAEILGTYSFFQYFFAMAKCYLTITWKIPVPKAPKYSEEI